MLGCGRVGIGAVYRQPQEVREVRQTTQGPIEKLRKQIDKCKEHRNLRKLMWTEYKYMSQVVSFPQVAPEEMLKDFVDSDSGIWSAVLPISEIRSQVFNEELQQLVVDGGSHQDTNDNASELADFWQMFLDGACQKVLIARFVPPVLNAASSIFMKRLPGWPNAVSSINFEDWENEEMSIEKLASDFIRTDAMSAMVKTWQALVSQDVLSICEESAPEALDEILQGSALAHVAEGLRRLITSAAGPQRADNGMFIELMVRSGKKAAPEALATMVDGLLVVETTLLLVTAYADFVMALGLADKAKQQEAMRSSKLMAALVAKVKALCDEVWLGVHNDLSNQASLPDLDLELSHGDSLIKHACKGLLARLVVETKATCSV